MISQKKYIIVIIIVLTLTIALMLEIHLRSGLPKTPHGMRMFKDTKNGIQNTPHYQGYSGFNSQIITYYTNSEGLRDYEHNISNTANKFRILGLGDSFTYGSHVNFNETYLRKLESYLNNNFQSKFEIIKTGVSGMSTQNEYNYLRETGINYSPDIILLGLYVGNDIRDNLIGVNRQKLKDYYLEFKPEIIKKWAYPIDFGKIDYNKKIDINPFQKPNYILDLCRFNLRTCDITIHKINLFMKKFINKKIEKRKISIFDHESILLKKYPPELEEGWNITFTYLKEINKFAESINSTLIIIIIPIDSQVSLKKRFDFLKMADYNSADFDFNKPQRYLIEFAEKNKIKYIDLLPEFQAKNPEGNGIYFDNDMHWTKKGHDIAAQAIFRHLFNESQKILKDETIKSYKQKND